MTEIMQDVATIIVLCTTGVFISFWTIHIFCVYLMNKNKRNIDKF